MTVDPEFPATHSFNVNFGLLRFWLGLLIIGMLSTATSARSILLDDTLRPVPYLLIIATALVWWTNPRSAAITRWCAAIIVTLLAFRSFELALFSDVPWGARRAPATLWALVAGTWIGIGKLMSHTVGRRLAALQVQEGRT